MVKPKGTPAAQMLALIFAEATRLAAAEQGGRGAGAPLVKVSVRICHGNAIHHQRCAIAHTADAHMCCPQVAEHTQIAANTHGLLWSSCNTEPYPASLFHDTLTLLAALMNGTEADCRGMRTGRSSHASARHRMALSMCPTRLHPRSTRCMALCCMAAA